MQGLLGTSELSYHCERRGLSPNCLPLRKLTHFQLPLLNEISHGAAGCSTINIRTYPQPEDYSRAVEISFEVESAVAIILEEGIAIYSRY